MDTEISSPVAIQEKNGQAVVPKNMVPDLEWFNRNKTKFKDWQREIRLFFKSNRIIETNNKITAILAYLRGDVAGIYAQKKLNELNEEIETQDQEEFV